MFSVESTTTSEVCGLDFAGALPAWGNGMYVDLGDVPGMLLWVQGVTTVRTLELVRSELSNEACALGGVPAGVAPLPDTPPKCRVRGLT